MFTAIEQMKVKLDKQHKTLGVIQNMVEGLCSGVGSVITENIETLPEEVRFPLKTTEELDHLDRLVDDKKILAFVVLYSVSYRR